jgi:hypothetical protein
MFARYLPNYVKFQGAVNEVVQGVVSGVGGGTRIFFNILYDEF